MDGRGLWFVTRGPTTISFLGFQDDRPRVVYFPPKQMPYLEPSISLSNDGRSLIFSMIDHSDDEVMRVEFDGL